VNAPPQPQPLLYQFVVKKQLALIEIHGDLMNTESS
jgi:hypothetical protein